MVYIDRPEDCPDVLETRGKICRKSHEDDIDQGLLDFKFRSNVYANNSVKKRLVSIQHKKCCFCERKVGMEGDVEHFRPKSGSKQAPGEPLVKPGYYWLAYDWSNLFLACGPCNQRNKGNLFPLRDPALRAHRHDDDISLEEPMFIKPDEDDPRDHIGFRAEVGHGSSPRGQATVEALGLNRDELCEERLERLQTLRALRRIVALGPERLEDVEFQAEVVEAAALLHSAESEEGQFLAAYQDALSTGFAYVPRKANN